MADTDPIRARIIEELRTLDEFDDPLLPSTQTSVYERKQALKQGLPASFVEQRRDELEAEYWTRLVGGLSVPVLVAWMPMFFDLSGWIPAEVLPVISVILAFLVAVQRARDWSRYKRRMLLYDLLAADPVDAKAFDNAGTEPVAQPA